MRCKNVQERLHHWVGRKSLHMGGVWDEARTNAFITSEGQDGCISIFNARLRDQDVSSGEDLAYGHCKTHRLESNVGWEEK